MSYYTVVFKVDGPKAVHDEWWQSIRPLFMTEGQPISVTAASTSDEMTRLNVVERLAERSNLENGEILDLIREVLATTDLDAWRMTYSKMLAASE